MSKLKTKWKFGLATLKGRQKLSNEDQSFLRIFIDERDEETAIALVADGMGGYQKGDVASKLVLEMIKEWCDERFGVLINEDIPLTFIIQELYDYLFFINDRLLEFMDNHRIKLGTTLSLIILYKGKYIVVHVGDSRIYYIQNDSKCSIRRDLLQLTYDHSWVNKQLQLGIITQESAETHINRNVLLQCLGINRDLEPFLLNGAYENNDLFMLCSDGFHTSFTEIELKNNIAKLLEGNMDLQTMCNKLVQLAYQAGAMDDITVVLLQHTYD